MKILFLLFPFFLLFLQGTEILSNAELEGEIVVLGAASSLKHRLGNVSVSYPVAAGYGVDALNSVSRMSPSLLAPGNSS
ncbi:gallinacin-3-like [Cygnus atratus]|uniref:gallinacin-3-like n=1 Tax=Cygnus atratus TaxID=8868 RepID=UPI0015D5C034|nr:gallinacin-3-like [Cygnus atratus]